MVKAASNLSHVKYPDIEVRLVGEDGNAFAIMGRVTRHCDVQGCRSRTSISLSRRLRPATTTICSRRAWDGLIAIPMVISVLILA